jgi:uncharacterized protein
VNGRETVGSASGDVFREATAADWPSIVRLNDAEVPKVGPLRDGDGAWYLAHAEVGVVERGEQLVALLITLTEGSDYASPNYRWFAQRYERFAYVDRIVVRADANGTGIGRRLYDLAADRAVGSNRHVLTAEVNLDPPNERSLAFHRRYGFVQVGEHVDPRNGHTEAMFALDLASPPTPLR